jgi:NAD(P)-dependent dehydrogenase (short-subunit alcohol dehydrogenase family)
MQVVADLPGEQVGGELTAADAIAAGAPAAMFVGTDVAKGKQVSALMAAAHESYGRIDVIYANAGISGGGGWAHDIDEDDFMHVVAVNLGGVFNCAKYGLPHLVESQGVLVNTASSFGMVGAHLATSYCASKGGVINLTRQLAVDYGPLGVRVLAICPGYVEHAMGRTVPGVDPWIVVRSLTFDLKFAFCPCSSLHTIGCTSKAWVVFDSPTRPWRGRVPRL